MFVLNVVGKDGDGVYAVNDDRGNKVLLLFEEEDDALRYSLQLTQVDEDIPELSVVEVEDEVAIKACALYDYPYTVVTSDDIIVPQGYDSI